jgi:hypothetical protein
LFTSPISVHEISAAAKCLKPSKEVCSDGILFSYLRAATRFSSCYKYIF